ncbi:MAG: HDOD domain-containing protein [bacterium]
MELEEAIARVENIPTLSTILGEVLRVTSSDKSSVQDLSRIIYSDQSIATKILKMANSAFYGFAHQVSSIERAIVVLGFNEVRSIAIAMTVFESVYLKKKGAYYNRLRSWNHSLLCGSGSRILAERFLAGKHAASELFMGGLIHDVGKVIIDRYFPDEFAQILELVEQSAMSCESAEREVLGFDHALLAGNLLRKWAFPSHLINMVLYHHSPESAESDRKLVASIFLADVMCHQLGYSAYAGEPKQPIRSLFHSRIMSLMERNGIVLTFKDIISVLRKLKGQVAGIEQFSDALSLT